MLFYHSGTLGIVIEWEMLSFEINKSIAESVSYTKFTLPEI